MSASVLAQEIDGKCEGIPTLPRSGWCGPASSDLNVSMAYLMGQVIAEQGVG